jgi:uncharacterized protein (DUF1499 family)
MASTSSSPRRQRLLRAGAALARLAAPIGVIAAAAALLAGPSYRMHWLSLAAAFQALRWATCAAIAAAVLAALALVVLTLARAVHGRATATAVLVLGVLVAVPPLYLYSQAQRLPKIHDISTDTDDPPVFVAVLPLRQGARNPVAYLPDTAAQQKLGYPDIAPARLELPPAEAFERAERAARAMGWRIVALAPDALRIEATDTSLFFGFEDDIVIRVRPSAPDAHGSIVDMRSLSRIGGSDIGANARRVRAFLDKLAAGFTDPKQGRSAP